MYSSRQFVIMSLHGGQKYYHEMCANYLSYSAISSNVSGKGSMIDVVQVQKDYNRFIGGDYYILI